MIPNFHDPLPKHQYYPPINLFLSTKRFMHLNSNIHPNSAMMETIEPSSDSSSKFSCPFPSLTMLIIKFPPIHSSSTSVWKNSTSTVLGEDGCNEATTRIEPLSPSSSLRKSKISGYDTFRIVFSPIP